MEATELELENDEPQVATVPSTWRSMQSLADSELQTDPVEVAETSAQTTRAVTIEVCQRQAAQIAPRATFSGRTCTAKRRHHLRPRHPVLPSMAHTCFALRQTQTEPLEAEEGKEVDLSIEGWVPDADIADFLARVAPVMDAHLRRNAASHAFDGACDTLL